MTNIDEVGHGRFLFDGLANIERDLLDELADRDDDLTPTQLELVLPVTGSLDVAPRSLQTQQLPANHMVSNQFTVGTTPVQIAFANPYRQRMIITKITAATLTAIAETAQDLITNGLGQAFAFNPNSVWFDINYTGDLWCVAASPVQMSVLELLATNQ